VELQQQVEQLQHTLEEKTKQFDAKLEEVESKQKRNDDKMCKQLERLRNIIDEQQGTYRKHFKMVLAF